MLLTCLVLVFGVATAPIASAHVALISEQPKAGSELGATPQWIALTFSEDVSVSESSVTLVDSRGATIPFKITAPGSSATTIRAMVPALTSAGPVTIAWKATAADDGHVTTGTYRLRAAGLAGSVQPAAAQPAPAPRATEPTTASPDTAGVDEAFVAVRMTNFLAIAVLCGGLAFVALAWPAGAALRRTQAVLLSACAVGIVTSVLGIGLEGATILQKPLISALSVSAFENAMRIKCGRVWAGTGMLFALAVPLARAMRVQGRLAIRSAGWRVAATVVGLGLIRMPGLIAHSDHGPHPDLGSAADLMHVAGVSVWLGGLLFLLVLVLPRRQPHELALAIRRFSTMAMISVGAIVIGGVFLSWQLIGSVSALFNSSFGHVLLVKLGIFAAVMIAAQASRGWVQRRLDLAVFLGGDKVTLRPFLVSVGAEAVLAVTVLTVASVLVDTNPVR